MAFVFKKRRYVIIGLVALLVFLYHTSPLSSRFDTTAGALATFSNPITVFGHTIQQWGRGIFNGNSLSREIAEQKKKIAELEKKLLERDGDGEDRLASINISARVIARNTIGSSRTLLLDRGITDGVSAGSAVTTPEGVFVGKIIGVYEKFSLVLPVTDSNSAVAAQIGLDSRYQSIVRGHHGLSLIMELVAQDAQLKEGDVVVTSLLEENTPSGLLLGTVASITYTEGELFKKAALTPFLSAEELFDVEIFAPFGNLE